MEKFLHALNSAPGCQYRILSKLWKVFGDWRYVWEKSQMRELLAAGLAQDFVDRFLEFRRQFDPDKQFAELWEKDIAVMSREHREYPKELCPLPNAPFLLYRKGASLVSSSRKIAMVGTRAPSRYGENIAYDLAEALAHHGVITVSGLAFGIDAVVHFSTVSAEKPTVAVLASGLYEITPTTHHRLSEKILECGGSLISEYPPLSPAYPYRFLERNRIIAGLAEAVVVIEAGERSGALATARRALDYGREVFALPGDILRPQARGCLKLLHDGAHPLIGLEDFFQDIGLNFQKGPHKKLTENQLTVLEHFGQDAGEGLSTDRLMELTGLGIGPLSTVLTELELAGRIKQNVDFCWEKCS